MRPSRPRTAPHSSTRRGGPPQRTPSARTPRACRSDRAGLRRVQRDLFVSRRRPVGCRRRFRIAAGAARRTRDTCADLSRTGLHGASAGGVAADGAHAGGGLRGNARTAFEGGAIAHIKLIGCRRRLKGTPSETLSVTPVTRRPSCPVGGGCTNEATSPESAARLHPGTDGAGVRASSGIRWRDVGHVCGRLPPAGEARRGGADGRGGGRAVHGPQAPVSGAAAAVQLAGPESASRGPGGRQSGCGGLPAGARAVRRGQHPGTATKKAPHPKMWGLPTAVLTGFEPAASTLTGWRALQTAPQDLAGEHRPFPRRAARQDSTPVPAHRANSLCATGRSRAAGRERGPRSLTEPPRPPPSRCVCRRPGTPYRGRARSS